MRDIILLAGGALLLYGITTHSLSPSEAHSVVSSRASSPSTELSPEQARRKIDQLREAMRREGATYVKAQSRLAHLRGSGGYHGATYASMTAQHQSVDDSLRAIKEHYRSQINELRRYL